MHCVCFYIFKYYLNRCKQIPRKALSKNEIINCKTCSNNDNEFKEQFLANQMSMYSVHILN